MDILASLTGRIEAQLVPRAERALDAGGLA
jgi:hypothetical protein